MADDADATVGQLTADIRDASVEDLNGADEEQVSEADSEHDRNRSARPVRSPLIVGAIVITCLIVVLGGLLGWLAHRAYQSHQAQDQRQLFLQVGRQGALNLTTIDFTRVEADIQRVLDSSTGTFHDEFQQRSAPFAEVVKEAQSKSEGAVVDAGIESISGDAAQVLVSVSVKTTSIAEAEQEPRHWRMRISVQKDGDGAKVSNVGFVP